MWIIIALSFLSVVHGVAAAPGSVVDRVRLYPGRAEITRRAELSVKRGSNLITIGSLPRGIEDWSVRGLLEGEFQGKIISLKVEEHAMLDVQRKRVREIEIELESLRDQDRIHLDRLSALNEEYEFLKAFRNETGRQSAPSILTGKEGFQKFEESIKFAEKNVTRILSEKREVEKKRRDLGREIQRLEFELRKFGGEEYFEGYINLSEDRRKKVSSLVEQNFQKLSSEYVMNRDLRISPAGGPEVEKRILLELDSRSEGVYPFVFSYLINDGNWEMNYDLRAFPRDNRINLSVYGDIRQTTGEDWENVELILSTGSPSASLSDFSPTPWYLDVRPIEAYPRGEANRQMKKESAPQAQQMDGPSSGYAPEEAEAEESGLFIEYRYPIRVSIPSSGEYQRRLLKESSLNGGEFQYELFPETSPSALLKYIMKNPGPESLLNGEARLFYENQFTGRAQLPLILPGSEERVLIAREERLIGKKTLIKKFQETGGVFGGRTRIRYAYRIDLENRTGSGIAFLMYDRVPVSRSEKIEVRIEKGPEAPVEDPSYLKDPAYEKGFRRYRIQMAPGEKRDLNYEIIITHDASSQVMGLP